MQRTDYLETLPPVRGAGRRRRARTTARLLERLEAELGSELDLLEAEWEAVVRAAPMFTRADWSGLRGAGWLGLLALVGRILGPNAIPPRPAAPAPADD